MTGALLLLLAASPKVAEPVAPFGPEFRDFDRITVRVLNVGVPTCTAEDLYCGPRLSHGSGLLFQQRGTYFVATNGHVVEQAQALTVLSPLFAEPAAASVVAADNRRDVALLRLYAVAPAKGTRIPTWEELQWLELSDDVDYVAAPEKAEKQLTKGDAVISLGFPLDPGQPDAERRDGRFTRWYRDEARSRWLLQTDITFLPGTSGGPLITPDGRIAGMIVYRTTLGGLGLAIPARGVQLALAEALKLGGAERLPYSTIATHALAAASVHLQQASHLLHFSFPRRSSLKSCAKAESRPPMCEVIDQARAHLVAARAAFATLPFSEQKPLLLRLLDLWARYRLLLLERYDVEPFTSLDARDAVLQDLSGNAGDLPAAASQLLKALPARHPSTGFVDALTDL